ncbi:hypothetical protein FJ365_03660 [Candidatus Dependentiae bacterium]|nr:hypothetical protein [Candidatus Dependentiae bacterium]
MPLQKLHNYPTKAIFEASYRGACFALGMTLFFSGCSKTQPTLISPTTALHLANAKHFDIPQPLGFTSTTRQSAVDNDYLLYSGTQPRAKVIDFYLRTMESNGWELQNFSNAFEGLLVCHKPHKMCTLSIRREKDTTVIHVFIKQRLQP